MNGGAGGNGIEWDATHGSGGGGGGGGGAASGVQGTGAAGGSYGGAGGGGGATDFSQASGGAAKQGLIVVTYGVAAATSLPNLAMMGM